MTQQEPFFSIIVPTKDRAELLYACLDSIVYQNFKNFECIVIDDGSIDQTKLTVESLHDHRIRYFYNQVNDRSEARNFGIDQAKGKFICFVDDDDWVTKDYLETFYKYLSKAEYGNEILRISFFRFENDQLNKTVHYNHKTHKSPVRFIAFNMCGVGSLCVPREYLEEHCFPAHFPHWQDSYLFLLLLSKYPMIQIPAHTYVYRIHDNMGSKVVIGKEEFQKRAEDNIAAIEDFRAKHMDKVAPYLSQDDFDFLVAEKYIQYAQQAKFFGFPELSRILKKRSIEIGRYWKLWKYYLKDLIS